jgi:hypothetical protein
MSTESSRQTVRTHPQGKGNLGCLLGLLILAALGYAIYQFAPPYISHYQLQDAMKEIATLSAAGVLPHKGNASNRSIGTISEIQEAVLVKARELEVPLEKGSILVRREGDVVFISVNYTVPMNLLFTVYNYKFDFTAHN